MANVPLENDHLLLQQQPASFFEYWLAVKRRRLMVLVITMASLCVAAALAWLWPYRYSAVVRLQVQPTGSERAVVQQAIESILSQPVLAAVVKQQDLTRQWTVAGEPISEADAVARLRSKASLSRRVDSSVVEIAVTDADDAVALRLAQAIADAAIADLTAGAARTRADGVAGIRRELADRQQALSEARQLAEALQLQIASGRSHASEAAIASIQQQANVTQLELLLRDARLAAMNEAARHQQYSAFAVLSGDGTVNTLVDQRNAVRQQMDQLPGYGPHHPQAVRLQEQLTAAAAQVDARVQARLAAARGEREATQAHLSGLKSQLAGWTQQLADVAAAEADLRLATQHEAFLQHACEQLELRTTELSPNLLPIQVPLSIMDPAQVARRPMGSLMLTALSSALAIGVMLGIGAALLLNSTDDSFRHLSDVEQSLRLPVVGVLQLLPPHASDEARSAQTEAYRLLRNQLECSRMDHPFKSLCVVSAAASEGKSSAVANLASVWVELGLRVLVIDTDLRKPSLHRLLGGTNEFGLADHLTHQRSIESLVQPTSVAGLSLIAAGQMPEQGGFITPAMVRQLAATVARQYDLVLYDTAAALQVSDSVLVAREVGTCLMVVQHHGHPQHMARRTMRMIQRAGASFVGAMVNKVHADEQELFFGYDAKYYYYGRSSTSLSPLQSTASPQRRAA